MAFRKMESFYPPKPFIPPHPCRPRSFFSFSLHPFLSLAYQHSSHSHAVAVFSSQTRREIETMEAAEIINQEAEMATSHSRGKDWLTDSLTHFSADDSQFSNIWIGTIFQSVTSTENMEQYSEQYSVGDRCRVSVPILGLVNDVPIPVLGIATKSLSK